MNKLDRFLGCLVGLAVGDALGTTLEFTSYEEAQANKLTDIIGGGPFKLKPGCWTDDTSMALCIADSLIEKKSFDAIDIMKKFSKWFRHGYNSPIGYCFDIGMATSSAIRYFETHGAFIKDESAAGNGAIMRLAPIPMMYCNGVIKCETYSKLNSIITHPSKQSIGSSIYMGGIISSLLNGDSKDNVLESQYSSNSKYWEMNEDMSHPLVWDIINQKYKDKKPGEAGGIVGSGYVISCLESALWAFERTDNFRDGVLLAVNLGNDADTTGAVYGQIAGAYYGLSGIPKEWLDKIIWLDEIKIKAEKLFELSEKI